MRAHLHVVGMFRFMLLTKTNRACPLLFFKYFVLVYIFVCMTLSTVFNLINSPDNSPLSHSVLPVSFLLNGPFNYVSLDESILLEHCTPDK